MVVIALIINIYQLSGKYFTAHRGLRQINVDQHRQSRATDKYTLDKYCKASSLNSAIPPIGLCEERCQTRSCIPGLRSVLIRDACYSTPITFCLPTRSFKSLCPSSFYLYTDGEILKHRRIVATSFVQPCASKSTRTPRR